MVQTKLESHQIDEKACAFLMCNIYFYLISSDSAYITYKHPITEHENTKTSRIILALRGGEEEACAGCVGDLRESLRKEPRGAQLGHPGCNLGKPRLLLDLFAACGAILRVECLPQFPIFYFHPPFPSKANLKCQFINEICLNSLNYYDLVIQNSILPSLR